MTHEAAIQCFLRLCGDSQFLRGMIATEFNNLDALTPYLDNDWSDKIEARKAVADFLRGWGDAIDEPDRKGNDE